MQKRKIVITISGGKMLERCFNLQAMNNGVISTIARNNDMRSIAKTVTWRILATMITGAVIYFYTGSIGQSSKMTVTAAIILTITYYAHERFWFWLRRAR